MHPPARIFFLIARTANKAVVFRKGPTKWTQMSTWNLEDDALELGQWTKINLRPRRCDLSPSGNYLLYLNDQTENGESFTAISKPPFWETLCKWKHDDPLFGTGGGLFKNESTLQLNGISINQPEGELPDFLVLDTIQFEKTEVYNLSKGHINPLLERRLKRDGWITIEDHVFIKEVTNHELETSNSIQPKLFEKQITTASFLWMVTYYDPLKHKMKNTFYIKKRTKKTRLEGITWADIDYKGRIIATRLGQLYASKQLSNGDIQLANLELVHDLNPYKPTPISAPNEMKKW